MGTTLITLFSKLNNMGISDPEKIREIAKLILNSHENDHIKESCELLLAVDDHEFEKIRQQIFGGR
jgi:hypothetical protein